MRFTKKKRFLNTYSYLGYISNLIYKIYFFESLAFYKEEKKLIKPVAMWHAFYRHSMVSAKEKKKD